jgi:ABC-type transporter Mla MlaB component
MATPALETTLCDLGALEGADVETIDLLARLQLAARRQGRTLLFIRASPALRDLIAFCGLEAVLRVEPGREAEQGEDPLGVEEERQLDDPAA